LHSHPPPLSAAAGHGWGHPGVLGTEGALAWHTGYPAGTRTGWPSTRCAGPPCGGWCLHRR